MIDTIAPARSAGSPFRPEQAALERLGGLIRAEMAELPPGSWALWRLGSDVRENGWGELVLPELAALLRAGGPPSGWVYACSGSCPSKRDKAVLRRLGALMRAQGSELDVSGSPLARRLDCWGIRLLLECECPQRPCSSPRRVPVRRFRLGLARHLRRSGV